MLALCVSLKNPMRRNSVFQVSKQGSERSSVVLLWATRLAVVASLGPRQSCGGNLVSVLLSVALPPEMVLLTGPARPTSSTVMLASSSPEENGAGPDGCWCVLGDPL